MIPQIITIIAVWAAMITLIVAYIVRRKNKALSQRLLGLFLVLTVIAVIITILWGFYRNIVPPQWAI